MSERTGGCMCGAVRFTASDVPAQFGICHCEMCRRWSGSATLSVSLPEASVEWTGAAHIRALQSSEDAERTWCDRCGSGLYYRPVEGPARLVLSLGLFDDPSGFALRDEIFIDCKPDSYAFVGDHPRRTRADVMGPEEVSS
ncbi:hypothetical protein ATO6_02795 [Oceanicola sp. 22II-s10i]|uniref:GFA family protein n=1 Tax=Oceanicola sp. 22II-s10i TaxID=1317116 RepID=UPI000B66D501|nr:GFA family protein [Oceanicola sp. 22II-s10i]OWU86738.1 hypothetical protein ATO6_02795 [Oceanicola sp. 22II-s10i]